MTERCVFPSVIKSVNIGDVTTSPHHDQLNPHVRANITIDTITITIQASMFGGLMNNLTSPFRSSPASTPTAAFATNSAPASPRNLSTEMSNVPPTSPPSHGSATAAAGNGPSNHAAGAQGIGTFPNDGSSVNDLTLSSPSLYVDSLKFFQLIQDAGTAYTSTRKPTKHWKPEKSPHKISYPKIYECGDTLFKNLSAASSLFPKIHKANPTRTRQNIMKVNFQLHFLEL